MHPADPRVALLRDHLVGFVLRGTDGIRFHLRELIGEGGQGWIYKANYDESDGLPIVVKVLRPDGMTEETLRRFQREAAVLRQLGSQANPNPNLVRFYDHGVVELNAPNSAPNDTVRLPFTVLEYVHGVTLADLVERARGMGLGAARTRRLLRQAAGALAAVHAQNITHRDLKPSNLLVSSEQTTEVVKVTDFGLAKLVDPSSQKTTMLAGASLGYAPPEQYEKGNERVGARTDVFSFAAIVFECLAGAPAFAYRAGENPMQLIQQIIAGPRPSLAQLGPALAQALREQPSVVAQLDQVLARALEADPDRRTSSIRELWDAIDPLLRSFEPSTSIPAPFPTASKQRSRESVNPSGEGAGYSFRLLGGLSHADDLRAVAVGSDANSAFAIGSRGVYSWSGAAWAPLNLPHWLDLLALRGIAVLSDSALLVFGERAMVATLAKNGDAEPWRLPDDDIDVNGALVERTGVVLVGRRRSQNVGVCVQAPFGRAPVARTLERMPALRAVARLSPAGALVACGDDGALARIDGSIAAAIPWGRTGHLLAIASRPDGGAYAVGTGGHALALSPHLQATLEAVQTTRDLLTVAVASDGSAWAGATERRLLQRRGTTWTRVPLGTDAHDAHQLLAVRPVLDRVVVFSNDGQVLEGRLKQ